MRGNVFSAKWRMHARDAGRMIDKPSFSSGRQDCIGLIGRGVRLPPQLIHTLCKTFSAQSAQ